MQVMYSVLRTYVHTRPGLALALPSLEVLLASTPPLPASCLRETNQAGRQRQSMPAGQDSIDTSAQSLDRVV